jgi:Flp pilus assembly protein TadG
MSQEFKLDGEEMLMPKLHNRVRRLGKSLRRAGARMGSERGSTLVEMALSSAVFLSMLFGIAQVCIALYSHNVLSEAAREASRYASIRGVNSCKYANSGTFPDCNLGPTDSAGSSTASTQLQNYLLNNNYPGAGNLQVTANWLSPTVSPTTGSVSWTLVCNTSLDSNAPLTNPVYGQACNYPGHAVQVQVTLALPLAIPFVSSQTLTLSSTSQMKISE